MRVNACLRIASVSVAAFLAIFDFAHAAGYAVTQIGGAGYQGNDLNNAGQVVGIHPATDFTLPGGFIWNNGTITFLIAPPAPSGSAAYVAGVSAINNAGQIAGTSAFLGLGGGSTTRGSLWNGGAPALLPPAGVFNGSFGTGINNAGAVVGYSRTGCCASAATLWSGGTATNLGTLGGSSSLAFAINNSGQIVGTSHIAGDSASHAALWSGGAITDLGAERAVAINDTGQIVGHSNSWGATFWNSSGSSPVNLGWGANTWANDINGVGVVVGNSTNPSWVVGPSHGVLWDGTATLDLNRRLDVASWGDWTITDAIAINDAGQILVRGQTFQEGSASLGGDATLLLTPCPTCSLVTADLYIERFRTVTGVPEPETYAMLLAGLGLLALYARRRKRPAAS